MSSEKLLRQAMQLLYWIGNIPTSEWQSRSAEVGEACDALASEIETELDDDIDDEPSDEDE